MTVHQCPRCDLRFPDMPEVAQHLVDDHGVIPETLEPRATGLPAGVHPHRRTPDPVHVARNVATATSPPAAAEGPATVT